MEIFYKKKKIILFIQINIKQKKINNEKTVNIN